MAKTNKQMMDKALSSALARANKDLEDTAGLYEMCKSANETLAKHRDELTAKLSEQTRAKEQALEAEARAVKTEKETRAQFVDLKSRLFDATKRIEYLTGYLARVQEDDHVREDLVPVGDPDGETMLTPKRKHKIIAREDHSEGRDGEDALIYEKARGAYDQPQRSPPRRWVNY